MFGDKKHSANYSYTSKERYFAFLSEWNVAWTVLASDAQTICSQS